MGQAAVRPAREAVYRRALAWSLAIAINGVLILSILLAPREAGEAEPLAVINLLLIPPPVAAPDPVEAAEETPEEPPLEAAPDETAPSPDTEDVPDPRPQTPDARNVDDTPGQDQEEDALPGEAALTGPVIGLPEYNTAAIPYSGGPGSTPYFLREVFCLTSSDATREAGHCPEGPDPDGLSMLRYASDANIAAGQQAAIGAGMSSDEIRARFEAGGLPLADLRGQSTLAETSQRTTSSSDEMRDSLPPRVPDPVFGD